MAKGSYLNARTAGACIIVLAALACGIAVWKLHAPHDSIAGSDGYVIRDGKVYWQEHMHMYTGENTPPADKLNAFVVAGADATTFKIVPLKHGVDIEADAEPRIFAYGQSAWGADKENIFLEGHQVQRLGSTTPAIDTATFETLGDLFIRDKQGAYEVENYYYWLIPGVDPKSFVVINRQYAKDAHVVYFLQDTGTKYEVLPIAGLDPSTFRVIGICGSAEGYALYAATDGHTILAGDTPIKGADPATFRIVGEYDPNPDGFPMTGSYAVDKNHVYKDCTQIIAGADPAECTKDNLKGCEGK